MIRNREEMNIMNLLLSSSSVTHLFYKTSVTKDKHSNERVQTNIAANAEDRTHHGYPKIYSKSLHSSAGPSKMKC